MLLQSWLKGFDSIFHRLEGDRRLQWICIIAISVLAAALRFYRLGEWSFWIEEHHTLRHVGELVSIRAALSTSRAFYYLITRPFLIAFGPSELGLRLPAAIIGIASIPLLYIATRRLVSPVVALVASAFLAISPWHIYWSQNARFYTLALVFYLASLAAFYWGVSKADSKYILLSAALLGLGIATHLLNTFIVLVVLIYAYSLTFINWSRPEGLKWRSVGLISIVPILGYLIYESILILVLDQPPLLFRIHKLFFNPATRSFEGSSSPFVMLTSTIYYIGTPLAIVSLVGALKMLRERSQWGLLMAFAAYVPLGSMLVLTYVASTVNRYVFMTLPFWILLGAIGLEKISNDAENFPTGVLLFVLSGTLAVDPAVQDVVHYMSSDFLVSLMAILAFSAGSGYALWRFLRLRQVSQTGMRSMSVLLLLVIVIAHPLLVDYMYFEYQHGHRHNWKEAASVIESSARQGDRLISWSPVLSDFYINSDSQAIHLDDPGLEEFLDAGGRYWVIHNSSSAVRQSALSDYVNDSCRLVERLDNFAAGHYFEFVIYLCEI